MNFKHAMEHIFGLPSYHRRTSLFIQHVWVWNVLNFFDLSFNFVSKSFCRMLSLIDYATNIYCPQFHVTLRLWTEKSKFHGVSPGCVAGRISYDLKMRKWYVVITFLYYRPNR